MLFILLMAKYLQKTYYGNASKGKAVFLLVQHDGDPEKFVTSFPKIPNVLGLDPNTFHKYLKVERDLSSSALAHSIAKKLPFASVVEVTIPRGIVDANRNPDCALPNVLDFSRSRVLRDELLGIQAEIHGEIAAAFSEFPSAVYLEMHTMASSPPSRTDYSDVPSYLDAWLNPKGVKRPVDLITFTPNGIAASNLRLAASALSVFSSLGEVVAFDFPYAASPHVKAVQYLMDHPCGLAMDIPKGILASGSSLDSLEVDSKKIERVAIAFANELKTFLACI